jgi:hypothetical protein
MSTSQDIDDCAYLYLSGLTEPRANALQAIVLEARTGPQKGFRLPDLPIIAGGRDILHMPGCGVFTITWSSYIAYSVRNESYAQDGTDYDGKFFRLFSKSPFLDYICAATFASNDFPGPYKHWQLACLDHVVDVVSTVEPAITKRIAV